MRKNPEEPVGVSESCWSACPFDYTAGGKKMGRVTVDQDSSPRQNDAINNNAKRSNAILGCSTTSLQTARILSQKSRLANRIAVAGIVIILFIQQGTLLWLFTHNSLDHQKQDDDAPHDFTPPSLKHELTPQELTGSPEKGSISCPAHLYPVYDRIVTTSQQQQQSSASYHHEVRRIPRMIHVSMKSRCLSVSLLTPTRTHLYTCFVHLSLEIPHVLSYFINCSCHILGRLLYENTEKWKSSLPNHSFYFHDDAAVDRLMNLPWPEYPQLKYMMQCVRSSEFQILLLFLL
jgi:hypothetical protein